MRILAVSGSLRESSFNTSLLRAALEAAPDGVELELWEGLGELPLYDEDLEHDAARVGARACARPGQRPTRSSSRRPSTTARSRAGSRTRSTGRRARGSRQCSATSRSPSSARAPGQFGALWAQQDLKRILGIAGARVVGTEIPVARAHERFDAEGRLLDGELFEQLRLHLTTLASEAVAAPERVAA